MYHKLFDILSFHHSVSKAIRSLKILSYFQYIARTFQSLFTTKRSCCALQFSIKHFAHWLYKAIFQGLTIHNNDILGFNDFMEIALTSVCNQLSWGGPKISLFSQTKKTFCCLHLRLSLLMHYFNVLVH